jgi:Tfp pilus assembly protein PilW
MGRLRDRVAGVITAQSGFTLIEALMAVVVGLMVIGTGVTVFTAAGRSQPGQVQRGAVIQQSRNSMERLTREIRQGSTVYPSTASSLSFLTYVHHTCGGSTPSDATQCKVTYTCSPSGSCNRVEAPPPGAPGAAGPAVTVISDLSSANVFRYTPSCSSTNTSGNPGYICVTLVYGAPNGDDALTLRDGAAPLNPT